VYTAAAAAAAIATNIATSTIASLLLPPLLLLPVRRSCSWHAGGAEQLSLSVLVHGVL
jgi:hypothetical protein